MHWSPMRPSSGGPSATVALVGNGPLTSEQRQEINAAGSVLRINAMNNRQASSAKSKLAGLQHSHVVPAQSQEWRCIMFWSAFQRSGCFVFEGPGLRAGSLGTR